MLVGQAIEQVLGDEAHRFLVICAGVERQRTGEADRRWRGKAGRADEGKEFGHVEVALLARRPHRGARRLRGDAQPFDEEGGVADQVRRGGQCGQRMRGLHGFAADHGAHAGRHGGAKVRIHCHPDT